MYRQGWDFAGGNLLVAGAFSIFSKEMIVKAGGFFRSLSEDMEVILRLHRVMKENKQTYRMMHLADPIAWTACPMDFKTLGKQRIRWHQGLLESLWYHKRMFFNPKYKALGLFVYPFWVFGEALEPLIEALGCLYILIAGMLGVLNVSFLLLFFCLGWGYTFLFTMACFLVEEMSFRKYPSLKNFFGLFFYSLFENFGYRQITIYWRLIGLWRFLKNISRVRQETKEVSELISRGCQQ